MASIRIKVDESLGQVLERVRKEVADNMKQIYGLKEVTVYGTLASQILAAKNSGKDILHFRIRKIGLNRGILELI